MFKGVFCRGPGYEYDFAKLHGKRELVIVKKFIGQHKKEVKPYFNFFRTKSLSTCDFSVLL